MLDCTAPTVLVYRSNILPQSETFIKEQMRACKRWRTVLVGRYLLNQLALDGLEVRLLDDEARWASGFLKILHRLGVGLGKLREERPLLLHAHFGPEAVFASALARALRLPMIVTLHGYDINIDRGWWESGHGGASMQNYPRHLLGLAARPDIHFLAVSDAIRARAVAYGIPAGKVTTNYIGVDPEKFMPGPVPLAERPMRILFVGRLVEKKGCEYLLRAMRIVKTRVPDAVLVVVGDGPLRTELEKMSRALGVCAQFRGALAPDRVRAELDAVRLLCLPSIRAANGDAEGFGLVLLEAQAAGVPVVSSALGGAREGILHGETGYAFEERDVEFLANSLTDLLVHLDKLTAMGQAARRFVSSRFDIRKCTETLENHYDHLARYHA